MLVCADNILTMSPFLSHASVPPEICHYSHYLVQKLRLKQEPMGMITKQPLVIGRYLKRRKRKLCMESSHFSIMITISLSRNCGLNESNNAWYNGKRTNHIDKE